MIRSTTPLKLLFEADRDLHRDGVCAEAVRIESKTAFERRTRTIELIDKANTRNAVLIGLTPNGFGLRLDTGDAVKNGRPHRPEREATAQLPS